jgi:hypothetical protein
MSTQCFQILISADCTLAAGLLHTLPTLLCCGAKGLCFQAQLSQSAKHSLQPPTSETMAKPEIVVTTALDTMAHRCKKVTNPATAEATTPENHRS